MKLLYFSNQKYYCVKILEMLFLLSTYEYFWVSIYGYLGVTEFRFSKSPVILYNIHSDFIIFQKK